MSTGPDAILEEPLQIQDGLARVPDRPGIGLRWRSEAVKALSLDRLAIIASAIPRCPHSFASDQISFTPVALRIARRGLARELEQMPKEISKWPRRNGLAARKRQKANVQAPWPLADDTADRPLRPGHLEISFGICSRRFGPGALRKLGASASAGGPLKKRAFPHHARLLGRFAQSGPSVDQICSFFFGKSRCGSCLASSASTAGRVLLITPYDKPFKLNPFSL